MPLLYPESGKTITSGDINKIMDLIIHRKWKNPTPSKEFYNVSDLVDLDWNLYFSNQPELNREAMLSYCYGLLGTRQNLFAIVVAATPVTTAMGRYAEHTKNVSDLGSKRAIVYVWRDPFPDASGRHKCFVQFFKWLVE